MTAPLSFMKSMKLYEQVGRIHNELRARGFDDSAPLEVSDLTPFDQYHYLGTAAVDEAARALKIGSGFRVLEVGSGIGGPARYLAQSTGCEVVALELQPDLHTTAVELTRRCQFDGQVHHLCGDILTNPLAGSSFHSIISFLVFLHIPDRRRLFDLCHDLLVENGGIFIEDFVRRKDLSVHEKRDLQLKVLCPYLPDAPTYVAELKSSGFSVEDFSDMSDPWTEFTATRLKSFRAERARNVALHGEAITDGLDDFYSTVARLFAEGAVGGARIHARREA